RAVITIPPAAEPVPEAPAPSSGRRRWPWVAAAAAVVALAVGSTVAVGLANRFEARRLKAALVGKWVATDGEFLVMDFHEDGTVRMTPFEAEPTVGSEVTEAEFKPAGPGRLELQLINQPAPDSYTFRASVKQDELILSEFKRSQRRVFFTD